MRNTFTWLARTLTVQSLRLTVATWKLRAWAQWLKRLFDRRPAAWVAPGGSLRYLEGVRYDFEGREPIIRTFDPPHDLKLGPTPPMPVPGGALRVGDVFYTTLKFAAEAPASSGVVTRKKYTANGEAVSLSIGPGKPSHPSGKP